MTRRRAAGGPSVAWALAALAAFLLFNVLFTEGFAHLELREGRVYGTLIDIVDRAAPLILVSLGMTLVIATGGIDLSVGAVMAVSGAVAAMMVSGPGGSSAAAIALALLVALAAGAGNGLLVTACGVQPIVATLVLMVGGRGIAQLLCGGQIVTFDDPFLGFLGNGFLLGLPCSIAIAGGLLLLCAILTRGTALGLFLEAVGDNPLASRCAGVRGGLVRVIAYAASGLLAGVAGLLVASDIRAADANNAGLSIELDAILAVVVGGSGGAALSGGRFSLAGSLVGALLIQSLTTAILSRGVPVELMLIVKALAVVVMCLLLSETVRGGLASGLSWWRSRP